MVPRRQSNVWPKLLAAMAFNPWTCQQLASAFHLDVRSIHAYLRDMRQDGLIYTCAWQDHSPGPPSRMWVMGRGTDVPAPPRQGTMDLRRKYRADPANREREALLKRNRRRLNKLKTQSLTATLLGI